MIITKEKVIEFGAWLTGHDEETVAELLDDYNHYKERKVSVPAETLAMPKIAVLYKQNDIPTDLDNSKLKHYLDWECEKSNLIDFIVEITEVLKTDSNFTA